MNEPDSLTNANNIFSGRMPRRLAHRMRTWCLTHGSRSKPPPPNQHQNHQHRRTGISSNISNQRRRDTLQQREEPMGNQPLRKNQAQSASSSSLRATQEQTQTRQRTGDDNSPVQRHQSLLPHHKRETDGENASEHVRESAITANGRSALTMENQNRSKDGDRDRIIDEERPYFITRFEGQEALQEQLLHMKIRRFRFDCCDARLDEAADTDNHAGGPDTRARRDTIKPVRRLGHFLVPHKPVDHGDIPMRDDCGVNGRGDRQSRGRDVGYSGNACKRAHPLFRPHGQSVQLESPGQHQVNSHAQRYRNACLLLGGGILSLGPNQQEDENTLFTMQWNSSGNNGDSNDSSNDSHDHDHSGALDQCPSSDTPLYVNRVKATVESRSTSAAMTMVDREAFRGFHRAWHRPVRLLDPHSGHYHLVSIGGQYDIHANNVDTIMLDLETLQWSLVFSRQNLPPGVVIPPGRIAHASISRPAVVRQGLGNYQKQISLMHDHTQMVVFGGFDGRIFRNDLWMFDMEERYWKELVPNCPYRPRPRCSHSCVSKSDGSQMILFGGWQGDTTSRFNDVHVFDFVKNTWGEGEMNTSGPSKPKARQLHSAEIIQDRYMAVVGGECNDGMLNDYWILDLESRQWFEIVPPCFHGPNLSGVQFAQRRGHASCLMDVTRPDRHGTGVTQTRQLAMVVHGGINPTGKLDDAYLFEILIKPEDDLKMRLALWRERSFFDVSIECQGDLDNV